MGAHSRKARRAIIALAERYGFTLQRTTPNRHLLFINGEGLTVTTNGGDTSDKHVLHHIERDFKRTQERTKAKKDNKPRVVDYLGELEK